MLNFVPTIAFRDEDAIIITGQIKCFIYMPEAFRCTYPYLFRDFQQH